MLEVFRREVKYLISTTDFYRIRPTLDALMTMDEHGGSDGYEVRSLYFDSAWDTDLTDVLSGLLSKQKVRLRAYSADAETFKLEFKCKTGNDSTKKSLPVSRTDARDMLTMRYEFLRELHQPVATELYGRLVANAYQPRVVVAYKRLAYTSALNDVRVTFDFDIGASFDPLDLFNESALFEPVSSPGSGVLEIKYNSFLPEYLQRALSELDSSPTSNSKYAQSRLLL